MRFIFSHKETANHNEREAANRAEFDEIAESIRLAYGQAAHNPQTTLEKVRLLLNRVKSGKTLDKLQRQLLTAYLYDASGYAHLELNRTDDGLAAMVKAVKVYETLPDKTPLVNNLLNQARAWMMRNDLKEAEHRLERALSIAKEGRLSQIEADVLYKLGVLYSLTDRSEKALEIFGHGLLLSQQIGNRVTSASFLSQFGQIYLQKGDLGKAEDYYERSRTVFEEEGEQENLMLCYGQLNQLYRRRSDYSRALEFAERGLQLAHELGNKREENIFLHDLTLIQLGMEDYTAATEHGKQSLELASQLHDHDHQIRALGLLTQIYNEQKDFSNALDYARQGYKLAQEKSNRREAALFLNDFADISLAKGETKQALEYFEQLVVILKAEKDWNILATLYVRMGDAYLESLNDAASAATIANQAFELAFNVESQTSMFAFTSCMRIIQLLAGKNYYNEALEVASQCLEQANQQLQHYRKAKLKLTSTKAEVDRKSLWLLFVQMLVVLVATLQDLKTGQPAYQAKVTQILSNLQESFGDTFTLDEWTAEMYARFEPPASTDE